jgi:hypothetical protein
MDFWDAIKNGNLGAVKNRVESILANPEMNIYPRLFASEFQFAVSKGFNEIAIYLAGINDDVLHAFRYDALVIAASQNNLEIVKLIIGNFICKFEENDNFGMAYRMAVKNNCSEVVDFLLNHCDIKFKISKYARSGKQPEPDD